MGGILAKGEAGKEGRPWTGPLRQRKGPKGIPQGAVNKRRLGYRRPFPARAESSISRKHKRQSPRYPSTRKRGFTIQSLR